MTALGVIGEEREVQWGPDVIRYREVGSGPTLVFVHGILASGVLWRDVVAASPGGSGALFRILRSAGTPCR